MSVVITPEWAYCSYPLVAEVYALCDFGCLYCFTRHKETWHNKASQRRKRGFDPSRDILDTSGFDRYFDGLPPRTKTEQVLHSFLQKRLAIQIGAQTEPAGKLELRFKRTKRLLELLRYKGQKYPVRVSVKGTAFQRDEYLRILDSYDTASVLVSLISTDESVLKAIEPNAPSACERFKMATVLSKCGISLGLRLRPIIPEFTDRTLDELIARAKDSGFQWVTVEWLRIPRTMTSETQKNYERLSAAIGFDLRAYYLQYGDVEGNRNGCLRLRAEATVDLYNRILYLSRKYDLPVASCNRDFRCMGTVTPNCCGIALTDPHWSRMQFSYAVHLAKQNGEVRLADFLDMDSPLFSVTNRDNVPKDLHGLSYGESLIRVWNDPEHRYYPGNLFRELVFAGKDEEGNHKFAYNVG